MGAQNSTEHQINYNVQPIQQQGQIASISVQNQQQNNQLAQSFGPNRQIINTQPFSPKIDQKLIQQQQTAHFTHSPLQDNQNINQNQQNNNEKQFLEDNIITPEQRKQQIADILIQQKLQEQNQQKQKKKTQKEIDQHINDLLNKGKQIEQRNLEKQKLFQEKEIQECTFSPNKSQNEEKKQQLNSRNFKQFLQDQNKFQEKKLNNIQYLKTLIDDENDQNLTYNPEITEKSKQIISRKNEHKQSSESVHERLYEYRKTYDSISPSHENVTQESKNNQNTLNNTLRINNATQRLYSDATKRSEKNQQKQRQKVKSEQLENSVNEMPSKHNSQVFLAQKLIKDFYKQLQQFVNNDFGIQNTLDYIQTTELIKKLNFVSGQQNIESPYFIKERILLNDLWIILNGQKSDYILARNLLVILIAILGVEFKIPLVENVIQKGWLNQQQQLQMCEDGAQPLGKDEIENSGQFQDPLFTDRQIYDKKNATPKQQQHLNRLQNNYSLRQFNQNRPQNMNNLVPLSFLNQQQSENVNVSNRFGKQNFYNNYNQTIDINQDNQNNLSHQTDLQADFFSPSQTQKNERKSTSIEDYFDAKRNSIKYGQFDKIGNLIIEKSDIKQIQKQFNIFYMNKLHLDQQKQESSPEKPSTTNNTFQTQNSKILESTNGKLAMSNNLVNNNNNPKIKMCLSDDKSKHHRENTDILAAKYRSKLKNIVSSDLDNKKKDLCSQFDVQMAAQKVTQKKIEHEKQLKTQKEDKQLTFHPRINNNYGVRAKHVYSVNENYQQEANNEEEEQPISPNFNQSSNKSNQGPQQRCINLYNQAKRRSELRDRLPEEIEYEKQCDQCTFNPDTSKSKQAMLDSNNPLYDKHTVFEIYRRKQAWQQHCDNQAKIQTRYNNDQNSIQQSRKERSVSKSPSQNSKDFVRFNRENVGNKFPIRLKAPHIQSFMQQYQDQPSEISKIPMAKSHQQGASSFDFSNSFSNSQLPAATSVVSGANNNNNSAKVKHQDKFSETISEEAEFATNRNTIQKPITQFVDIYIVPQKVDKVPIYQGETSEQVADRYVQEKKLNSSLKQILTQVIQNQIKK